MLREEKAPLCVSLVELQAFARIETGEEEGLLAGFLRAASETCERFLNQVVMARTFSVDVRAGDRWTLIPVQPIRSISEIRSASGEILGSESYRLDIDPEGRGHVIGLAGGETFTVTGIAGMAIDSNGVPEPIRHGILRLAAYSYANRDTPGGDVPKSVTALWRPYRRAGLLR